MQCVTTNEEGSGGASDWVGKRVLIVTSSYPFHQSDFRALFVHHMARSLVSAGASVSVLTPQTPGEPLGVETWDGVLVQRFSYLLGKSYMSLTGRDGIWENLRAVPLRVLTVPLFLAAFFFRTKKMLRDFQPDVLICHWLIPCAFLGAVLANANECRTINFAHGSDVHLCKRLPLGRRLIRYIAARSEIAATSGYIASQIEDFAPSIACKTLPLGVDGAHARNSEAGNSRIGTRSPARPRLCFLGRLLKSKGLARLADTMEQLEGYSLTIAGDGADREEFARHVRRRNLDVTFVGAVVGQSKSDFFADHDLFLFLPDIPPKGGFQDNLPISILEAMAHGLPVFSTPVGEVTELIQRSGAGRIMCDNPIEIARLVRSLSADDLGEMSDKALTVARRYSWEACVNALSELAFESQGNTECALAK